MWITTKFGFFSIVRAHLDPEATHPEPHESLLMVRSRQWDHLAALLENATLNRYRPRPLNPEEHIKESAGTDYPYRIFINNRQFAELVSGLAFEVDYCNFKNAVAVERPKDWRYKNFLKNVWWQGVCMARDPEVEEEEPEPELLCYCADPMPDYSDGVRGALCTRCSLPIPSD
jgi:hypothetical protein